jgi:5'-nucleotidase / UDP-sugar diphosphatase
MKKVAGLFFVIMFTVAGFAPSGHCMQSEEKVNLTILHTNDEHSHLLPHPVSGYQPGRENPAVGGFARLAGLVNQIRSDKAEVGEPVLLFSGGDIIGGTVFAWLNLQGLSPELNLMQLIGYDGIVIGNHEFDYGPDQLAQYLRSAGYPHANEYSPILGTNIHPPDNHPLSESGINRTSITELENGLKVGIFGLIGKDSVDKTVSPEPVEFSSPAETARDAVRKLREAGADLIISVNHSGVYEDRILAREVPEIDVIVGGHSHTPLHEPVTEGKTVIVQAGSYLEYLGMLELSWDPVTGHVEIRNGKSGNPFLIPVDHTVAPDPDIEDMVNFYEETLNEWVEELSGGLVTDIRQPIARSSFSLTAGPPRQESNLGNFLTDAMRLIAEEVTGKRVDLAVQANGAIRSDVIPGKMDWSEGEITFYDMMMAVGLGSGADGNPGFPLVSFYLTEDEVRRAMEISQLLSELRGNTYYLQFSGIRKEYDPGRAVLMSIPFSGTPVPSTRAVLEAKLYTGSGIQNGQDEWRPIEKGSEELLHVVTDYYIASFLPLVGEVLPGLLVEFKDERGEAIYLDDAVISRNGSELKVWQAVLEYTAGLQPDDSGLPVLPDYYSTTGDRLVVVNTLPFWFWPAAGLLLLAGLAMYVSIRRRRQPAVNG